MEPNLLYEQFWQQVESCNNISAEYKSSLGILIFQSDRQSKFSKPMPWIGMYIALASLLCIFAMVADLLHGLRNRKLWFPCKNFTLNAASLTIIAVAMKLPTDLNNLMPGYVDRSAKLGSMGFMCTMMANLLPSLATMDSKELISNMIALVVLVITLVVDVCIQMNTGILTFNGLVATGVIDTSSGYSLIYEDVVIATIYVAMLLKLLMIYACSSIAILKSKQILESKYQAAHETNKDWVIWVLGLFGYAYLGYSGISSTLPF